MLIFCVGSCHCVVIFVLVESLLSLLLLFLFLLSVLLHIRFIVELWLIPLQFLLLPVMVVLILMLTFH